MSELLKLIPEWVPWAVASTTCVGALFHRIYVVYKAEEKSKSNFDSLAQSYSEGMTREELVSFYNELGKYQGPFIGEERCAVRDTLTKGVESQLAPIIRQEIMDSKVDINSNSRVEELSPTFKMAYKNNITH